MESVRARSRFFTPLVTLRPMGPVVIAISDIMVLFNSSVNPFVYALFNQNFREKMNGILRCSKATVGATEEHAWSVSTQGISRTSVIPRTIRQHHQAKTEMGTSSCHKHV